MLKKEMKIVDFSKRIRPALVNIVIDYRTIANQLVITRINTSDAKIGCNQNLYESFESPELV